MVIRPTTKKNAPSSTYYPMSNISEIIDKHVSLLDALENELLSDDFDFLSELQIVIDDYTEIMVSAPSDYCQEHLLARFFRGSAILNVLETDALCSEHGYKEALTAAHDFSRFTSIVEETGCVHLYQPLYDSAKFRRAILLCDYLDEPVLAGGIFKTFKRHERLGVAARENMQIAKRRRTCGTLCNDMCIDVETCLV